MDSNRNFLIGMTLNNTKCQNMIKWNNAFNFGALPEIYDENGNLRDKFKKQIAAFNKLKEKRNKV
jgi:hypothetical protein